MAERNAVTPQSLDDDAAADLIRQLQVVGRLGILNVSDTIVPMYLLGQRAPLDIEVVPALYAPGEVFSAGRLVNPAAGTVLSDTTALTAGDYDFLVDGAAGVSMWLQVQHRNAANAANINEWGMWLSGATYRLPLSLVMAENERLRVLNLAAPGAGVSTQASILGRAR